ncbi:hypothetical protein [Kamptonema formosum]|uniref:hypothetical protein n=1 Tax=Kamptonema formosum TaxID=331992 RepID=UPI00034501AA|nr:hypothetical protein [Oscillatoria sp. PCC 10802]
MICATAGGPETRFQRNRVSEIYTNDLDSLYVGPASCLSFNVLRRIAVRSAWERSLLAGSGEVRRNAPYLWDAGAFRLGAQPAGRECEGEAERTLLA